MGEVEQNKKAQKLEDKIKKVVTFTSKAKLVITEEFLDIVEYICKRISTVEWSGVVLYEKEGNSNDPSTLVITPKYIYPLDKGTGTYTEYSIPEDFMDVMVKYPEYLDLKMGHIHSHVNMGTFFSGTDVDELKANCQNHDMYFSIIVNNRLDICAKIAIEATSVSSTSSKIKFKSTNDDEYEINDSEDKEEKTMLQIEFDIERPPSRSITVDDLVENKIESLLKSPAKLPATTVVKGFVPEVKKSWEREYTPHKYGYDRNFDTQLDMFGGPAGIGEQSFPFLSEPDDESLQSIRDGALKLSPKILQTFPKLLTAEVASGFLTKLYSSQFETGGDYKSFTEVLHENQKYILDELTSKPYFSVYEDMEAVAEVLMFELEDVLNEYIEDLGVKKTKFNTTLKEEMKAAIVICAYDYVEWYTENLVGIDITRNDVSILIAYMKQILTGLSQYLLIDSPVDIKL